MKHLVFHLFALLTLSMPLASCGEEDAPLPPMQQAFAEMLTDNVGRCAVLRLDNGENLVPLAPPTGLPADTLLRVVALFSKAAQNDAEAAVTIHNFKRIFCAPPRKYSADVLKTDALTPVFAYHEGNYLNLEVEIKSGGAINFHKFGFHLAGIDTNADGTRTLHLKLLHDQGGDPLFYSHTAALSCPLPPLATLLQAKRDSVCLSVETFGEKFEKRFLFNPRD